MDIMWIISGPVSYNEQGTVKWILPKRICMGELLARNEIFLFTVNLLQKIRFLPPEKNPIPRVGKYNASFTRIPDHYYLRVEHCWCSSWMKYIYILLSLVIPTGGSESCRRDSHPSWGAQRRTQRQIRALAGVRPRHGPSVVRWLHWIIFSWLTFR